jgi:type IV pilus assembly protein PilQ
MSSLNKAQIMFLTVLLTVAMTAYSTPLFAAPVSMAAQGSFTPVADGGASGEQPSVQDLGMPAFSAVHYDAPRVYKGERISLDFQNADIHNIIRIIGEVSGKNIIVSDAVTGKVTLKLKDVPWDQALDIVLSSRNLGVEESGNVLSVYDLPTLTNLQATRNRAAAERAEVARQAPLGKKVFTPKYSPIGVVKAELEKLKTERGKIAAIGNDIYVEDDPGTLATMTQVFMRIDRVARQILIEARIIEASASFTENLGIQWGGKYQGGGLSSSDASGRPGQASGSLDIAKGASLGFGFLNKANSLLLSATIKANEITSDARTISSPRIMAANDQEVYIKQGQQIPYQSGSSATTAANTSFKDVVMELRVKPHIEENGQIVTLDIKLTNDTPEAVGSSGAEPAINTREAETKLMVKDGETVVIGGIIVDNQSTGYDRVPGMHKVPLLGWLFQERAILNTKSEMLIFITANIIPISI